LQVEEFLDQLPVGTLPGVGSVLKEKLVKQNIQTCGQLRLISKVKPIFVVMDMSGCYSIVNIIVLLTSNCWATCEAKIFLIDLVLKEHVVLV